MMLPTVMDKFYIFTVIAAYFVSQVSGQTGEAREFSIDKQVELSPIIDPTPESSTTAPPIKDNAPAPDPNDIFKSSKTLAQAFGINIDRFRNGGSGQQQPSNMPSLDLLDAILKEAAGEGSTTPAPSAPAQTDFMAFLNGGTSQTEPSGQGVVTSIPTSGVENTGLFDSPFVMGTNEPVSQPSTSNANGIPVQSPDQSLFLDANPSPDPSLSADPSGTGGPFNIFVEPPTNPLVVKDVAPSSDTEIGGAKTDSSTDLFAPDPSIFAESKTPAVDSQAGLFGSDTANDIFAPTDSPTTTPTPEGGIFGSIFDTEPANANGPAVDSQANPVTNTDTSSGLFGPNTANDIFAPTDSPTTTPTPEGGIFGSIFNNEPANDPITQQGSTNANDNTPPVESPPTPVDATANAQNNMLIRNDNPNQNSAFADGQQNPLAFNMVPGIRGSNALPMDINPRGVAPPFQGMQPMNQFQRFPQVPPRRQSQNVGVPRANQLVQTNQIQGPPRGSFPFGPRSQALRQQQRSPARRGEGSNQQSENQQNLLPFAENVLEQVQTLVDNLKTSDPDGRVPSSGVPGPESGNRQMCRRRCPRDPCRITFCMNIYNARCVPDCRTCRAEFFVGNYRVSHICEYINVGRLSGQEPADQGPRTPARRNRGQAGQRRQTPPRRQPPQGQLRDIPLNTRIVPGPDGQPMLVPATGPGGAIGVPPPGILRMNPTEGRGASLGGAERGVPDTPLRTPRRTVRVQGSLGRRGGRIDPRDPRLQSLPPQLMPADLQAGTIFQRRGERTQIPDARQQIMPPNVGFEFPSPMNGMPMPFPSNGEIMIGPQGPQPIFPTGQPQRRTSGFIQLQNNQPPNSQNRRTVIERFERARAAARQMQIPRPGGAFQFPAGAPQSMFENPTNSPLRSVRPDNGAAAQQNANTRNSGTSNGPNQPRGPGLMPTNFFTQARAAGRGSARSF